MGRGTAAESDWITVCFPKCMTRKLSRDEALNVFVGREKFTATCMGGGNCKSIGFHGVKLKCSKMGAKYQRVVLDMRTFH